MNFIFSIRMCFWTRCYFRWISCVMNWLRILSLDFSSKVVSNTAWSCLTCILITFVPLFSILNCINRLLLFFFVVLCDQILMETKLMIFHRNFCLRTIVRNVSWSYSGQLKFCSTLNSHIMWTSFHICVFISWRAKVVTNCKLTRLVRELLCIYIRTLLLINLRFEIID
jgi:hypothetical protein